MENSKRRIVFDLLWI